MNAIVMTEEFWRNSQFSVAKYTGQISIDGTKYFVVDKRGLDLLEASIDAQKTGREYAIEPGEPADLCRVDFIPIYKKLGRETFLQFIKENPDINNPKAARERLKVWKRN